MINGHCSQCHRVWTLETEQGVCSWCGKAAVCHSIRIQALRSFKSRRRTNKQAKNPNGYEQLEGEWATYYEVASKFSRKAKPQDRDDLLHDIILTLADVKRNNGHKPFTEATMYRIASVTVAHYWRAQYKSTNGLDCGSCSKVQRAKCRKDWLYPQCPKAYRLESLAKPVTDSEGNITELGELIADDKALDLAEWIDSRTFLAGCPKSLIAIANKIVTGKTLSKTDRQYLWRYRKKTQKSLTNVDVLASNPHVYSNSTV